MSIPALITHDGRVLSQDTPTPSQVVEEREPESLDVIAAREAAKQSTTKHQ